MTRALVRSALSAYGTLPPREWRFRVNAHGRPEIEGDCELRFNAANAEELVVCAVTRGSDVGVDVEPHGRGASVILSVAPRVFSEEEIRAIGRADEERKPDVALSLWTLKEAYLKARGTGLTESLRDITFSLKGQQVALIRDPNERDVASWQFRLLDVDLHRVAIAVRRGVSNVRLRRLGGPIGAAPKSP
jgi:4'-phosphopantetheinyl transferase